MCSWQPWAQWRSLCFRLPSWPRYSEERQAGRSVSGWAESGEAYGTNASLVPVTPRVIAAFGFIRAKGVATLERAIPLARFIFGSAIRTRSREIRTRGFLSDAIPTFQHVTAAGRCKLAGIFGLYLGSFLFMMSVSNKLGSWQAWPLHCHGPERRWICTVEEEARRGVPCEQSLSS